MKKIIVGIMLVALAALLVGCNQEFAIKDVTPKVGVLAGGEPITILGSGFDPNMGLTVYFGTNKADNVVVASPTELTVSSPSAMEPGEVNIRVARDDGREYLIKGFRYVEKSSMDIRDLGQRKSKRQKDE